MVRDGIEIVCIAIERAQQDIRVQGQVGARHPANATSSGKVLFADLDVVTVGELLNSRELYTTHNYRFAGPPA